MGKAQRSGMQRLARQCFEKITIEGPSLPFIPTVTDPIATVNRITEYWVRNVGRMDPDLVRTPCLQAKLGQGRVAEGLDHTVVRNGVLAFSSIHSSHFAAIPNIPCQIRGDST